MAVQSQTKQEKKGGAKEEVRVDIKEAGPRNVDPQESLQTSMAAFEEINRGLQKIQQELTLLMQSSGPRIQPYDNQGPRMQFQQPGPFTAGIPPIPGIASILGTPSTPGAPTGLGFPSRGGFAGMAPMGVSGVGPGAVWNMDVGGGALAADPTLAPWLAPSSGNVPPVSQFQGAAGAFASQRSGPRLTQDIQSEPPHRRVPEADLVDEGSEYLLRMELPGIKKEDLEILCFGQSIVVEGNADADLEDGTVLLSERGKVNFRRSVTLPAEIQTSGCEATLKDGILTARLQKRVPTDRPRRLDVAYG